MNNNSMVDPNMFYGIYTNNQRNNMNPSIQDNQYQNGRFSAQQNDNMMNPNLLNTNGTQNNIMQESAMQNNMQGLQQNNANQNYNSLQNQINTNNLRNNSLMNNNANQSSLFSDDLNNSIYSPLDQAFTITQDDIQYMDGFIGMQLGRGVNIDFLIGNNNIVSKSGNLVGVGRDYILIAEFDTDDIIACRIDDIRFITFLEN